MQLKEHGAHPTARAATPNQTGLPDKLKAGLEALSGLAMDDVRVHRNSADPAKLGALAFAKGNNIHLAPGEERQLPHEAWHVVQQKQGRVPATLQLKGVALNTDSSLEAEADRMGHAALAAVTGATPVQRRSPADPPTQLAVGFEFQARHWQFYRGENEFDPGRGKSVKNGTKWHLESDGGEPEFIIDHRDEATNFNATMGGVTNYAKQFKDGFVVNPNLFNSNPKQLTIKSKKLDDPVTADPQVTAGVRFERLSTMISMLSQRVEGQSLTQANAHLMQNRQAENYKGDDRLLGEVLIAVRRELAARFPDSAGYDDEKREHVTGLLALLASYLRKMLNAPLWKDVPLLSKSNLGHAVQNSPLATVQNLWLQDPNGHPATLLKEIVIEASGRQEDHYVLPQKSGSAKVGPKCGQWLDGLFLNRVDRLSYLQDSSLDPSMGPLDRVDQVGNAQAPAPILEMRRINHEMPYTEWAPFVEQVRLWLVRLNDLQAQNLDYQPPP
ncbi:MAG TPA: DUF4157 domain-containing protein [Allosphingosinicella sp.]|nr:DUF4157 domain-containing protein [Allosphingosinicella sp.]